MAKKCTCLKYNMDREPGWRAHSDPACPEHGIRGDTISAETTYSLENSLRDD